jgi:tetrahydromethanopterin S-methyltransferase subunit F
VETNVESLSFVSMVAGAVGALVADLAHDNALVAPRFRNGRLYLGSVGTLCLGIIAGAVMAVTTLAPLAAVAAGFCSRRWLPALLRRLLAAAPEVPKERQA